MCLVYAGSTELKPQSRQRPPKGSVPHERQYLTLSFCQREIKIIIKTYPADWRSHPVRETDLCSELRKTFREIVGFAVLYPPRVER